MTNRGRLFAGTLAIAVATTAVMVLHGSSAAQTETASARLVVTELTGILGPGSLPGDDMPSDGDRGADLDVLTAQEEGTDEPPPPVDLEIEVLVENDGDLDLSSLRLVVEVFDRTGERSTLRAALDGGPITTVKSHTEERLIRDGGEIEPGEIAGVSTTVTAAEAGWLERDGVYPVKISVVQGTDSLAEATTGVVYLEEPPTAPLNTVVVWPLDGEPWRDPLGRYPEGLADPINPGGRLERLLSAVESVPESGVILAPAAHLLEDLADRADGFVAVTRDDEERDVAADDDAALRSREFLARIREVATRLPHDPLAPPYADVDLAALVTENPALAETAGGAVTEGRRRVTRLLGRIPDAATSLSWTPVTDAVLGLLTGDRLLLGYDDIQAVDIEENPTTDLPPMLRTVGTETGRAFTATVADPFVERTLTAPHVGHGPLLASHRTVLETAMIFFEFPLERNRPLLILPPADWRADGRVATRIAGALAAAPWLDLVPPGVQAASADTAPPSARLAGEAATLPDDLGDALVRTRRRLDAVRAAIPDGAPIGGRTYTSLSDQLLRAPSRWFLDRSSARARAMVSTVETAVESAVGVVEIPSTGGITLTSETGRIPVTIQRPDEPLLSPLAVHVQVTSAGGLTWPDGQRSEVIELRPGESETVSFRTRAVSRGTFPVTVTVTDPSGDLVVQRTQLSVRSTAISGPALAVTGGVVVLLLLAGLLRRRSSQRPRLEAVE